MIMNPDLQRHVGKFYGKYSGDVTDNQDNDNLGRIMVKVPTVFGSDMTVQARPCLPYGHFFIPPVGAKIWVEFEAGDPNFALWVGTWYPTGATPTEAAIKPPDNRVIQTASGHTIEIMDKDGEEKITIKHKDNSFISIDKKGSVLIANKGGSHIYLDVEDSDDDSKVTLMEQHGNLISMTKDGVMIVNNDGSATLQLGSDLARIMAKNIVLEGTSVAVGAGAADPPPEPAILGQTFATQMWTALITALTTYATHTHPTAVGPSGPGVPPLTPPPPLAPGAGLASAVVVK